MQQRSEETHARILAAAQLAFARNGYEGSSVAQICQAASVSKGAFYHHFPSKQAVFLKLLQNWLQGLEEQLQVARQAGASVPHTLVGMSSLVRQVFQAADERLQMFLEFWSQASRDPTIWKATVAPYHRFEAFFAGMIAEGIAEGSFREVDPRIYARLIISLAVGVLLQGMLDPQGADWEQTAKEGMQALVQSLAREGR